VWHLLEALAELLGLLPGSDKRLNRYQLIGALVSIPLLVAGLLYISLEWITS